MTSFFVLFDDACYDFPFEKLTTVPYFNERIQSIKENSKCEIKLKLSYPVDKHHFDAFKKIVIEETVLIPMSILTTHLDVYVICKLCFDMGISEEQIIKSFNGWCSRPNWKKLENPAYLYLIYKMCPDLVNWSNFFLNSIEMKLNPYMSMVKALELNEVMQNPDLYLEIMSFYQKFCINNIFDKTDANTDIQRKILLAYKRDPAVNKKFTISPFSSILNGYINYTPSQDDQWSCDNITTHTRPKIGDSVICSKEEFLNRVQKSTTLPNGSSFLEKAPSGLTGSFPWENVIMAGGSISVLLNDPNKNNIRPQSDFDFFIYGGETERIAAAKRLFDWFATDQTTDVYYGIIGSVAHLYLVGFRHKIQIIITSYSSAYDVISHFDMSHIQSAFQGSDVICTAAAITTFRNRMTTFEYTKCIRDDRLLKALLRGFNIKKDKYIVENHIDMTNIINDKENDRYKQLISKIHQHYFIRDERDMYNTDEEFYNVIIGNVAKDANTQVVTNKKMDAMRNLLMGGSMNVTYSCRNYTSLIPKSVDLKKKNQYQTTHRLSINGSAVKMMCNDATTVMAVNDSEDGITIVCKPSNEFDDFLTKTLQGNVYSLFNPGKSITNQVIENSTFKLFIPKYKITNQTKFKTSILHDQYGSALNIEDELVPGDIIKFVFYIIMHTDNNKRCIEISPVRINKITTELKTDDNSVSSNITSTLASTPTAKPVIQVVAAKPVVTQPNYQEMAYD